MKPMTDTLRTTLREQLTEKRQEIENELKYLDNLQHYDNIDRKLMLRQAVASFQVALSLNALTTLLVELAPHQPPKYTEIDAKVGPPPFNSDRL